MALRGAQAGPPKALRGELRAAAAQRPAAALVGVLAEDAHRPRSFAVPVPPAKERSTCGYSDSPGIGSAQWTGIFSFSRSCGGIQPSTVFPRKEVLRMQEIAKLVLAGTADGGALGEYAREYASVSPNHDKKDN
ncbi:hypothetical protein GCM10029978_079430 [Actinoallomurus acanthiterrae]